MTEISFFLTIMQMFEGLENDDLRGESINGDVRKIYEICKHYLNERGKLNGEDTRGDGETGN